MGAGKPRRTFRSFVGKLVSMFRGKSDDEMRKAFGHFTGHSDIYRSPHALRGTPKRMHKHVRDMDTGYRLRPKLVKGLAQ